nr:hypothetical protein SHINE37_41297 [Rhizobiaceae bacterium]
MTRPAAPALQPDDPRLGSGEIPLTALTSLRTQLEMARVLKEHHIWLAVRIIEEREDQPQFRRHRRLRDLLEADALLEGVIELGAHLQPTRHPWSMGRSGDRWRCSVAWNDRGNLRRCMGRHDDLAAAMLIALLGSLDRRQRRPKELSKGGEEAA